MHCEIVLRGGSQLTFRPPLEELRERYYRDVQSFVAWPAKQFRGVGGAPELFALMP